MPEHTPTEPDWWVPPDGIPVHLRKDGFFVLKPLPSDLVLDQQTQQRRSHADRALGRLYEAAAGLPDQNVLIRPTQFHEIQSMLAFQGVTVSNWEIASVDLPDQVMALRPPYNVTRYLEIMSAAARDVRAASVGEILRRVARELADLSTESTTRDDLPWRTTQRSFRDAADRAYLLAAAPDADLRQETERLLEWIDHTTDMPSVDKAALGAYQLFTLDPFTNTADLLHVYITLELIKHRVLQDQIIPTSLHIDRNIGRFQKLHQHVVRTGDFNHWVRFLADGFAEQCGNQLRVIHGLAELPDKYRAKIPAARRRDGFARLLGILPSFQIVNAPLVADRCEVSQKRARELLTKAEGLEIVGQVGNRQRGRIYEVKDVRRAIDLYAGIVPETDKAVGQK